MNKLLEKKCVPCEGGVVPFDISEISKALTPPSQGTHFFSNKSLINEIILFLASLFHSKNLGDNGYLQFLSLL